MFSISPIDKTPYEQVKAKIDNKAKPLGSLGRIETLAIQLALILGPEKPVLKKPQHVVFVGDHGITAEGVSTAPSEVTTVVAEHFANGIGAINLFCRECGLEMTTVNAGMKFPFDHQGKLVEQSLGLGTKAFHTQQAMDEDTVFKGFALARELMQKIHAKGSNIVAFGELGLGNTTSAAALMAAFTGYDAKDCVGLGTGIDEATYQKKLALVEQSLALHKAKFDSPTQVLACLGGFEIVQMCGAMLSAAEQGMAVLVDGFIATNAALAAININPNVKDYLVFCHQSKEHGHKKLLNYLKVEPLFDVGLRLGEGTGAAISLPLVRTALAVYNDMAALDAGSE